MPGPRPETTLEQELPAAIPRGMVNWRFVALSSLFFFLAALIFFAAFSVQRINSHKAEQATAASAYLSQLTVMARTAPEQNLDELVTSFLGTLVGFKIFNCVTIRIDAMDRTYAWPYQDCQDFQTGDEPGLQLSSDRIDRPSARIDIHANLDNGTPIEKYAAEAGQIAMSALIMGLIGLFAVNLAFNSAVRRPLTALLEQLHHTLASSVEGSSPDGSLDVQGSSARNTYRDLMARAGELKRKEAFWRAVTDCSLDCVICADSQGHIIDFNAAAEKTFGYQRDDVMGRQITDLVSLDDFQDDMKTEWTVSNGAESSRGGGNFMQTSAFHADGRELIVELSIADIELEGERHFTAYLRDITEARRTLKALEQSETMLIQSAEIAQLGYAIWDDVLDRDVMVTDELARIHGFTKEDYLETVSSMGRYLELVFPDDRDRYMDYENRFAREASFNAASIEYRVTRTDGEIRHLLQRAQYLPASGARPTRSIVIIQDVTEQKQVELHLIRSRAALEESETMLTQSAEMANLGHAIWDNIADRYVTVSRGYAGILGYTREEFLATFTDAEKDMTLFHEEDLQRYLDWVREYDNCDEVPNIEFRIVRRDGEIRYLQEHHMYIQTESDDRSKSLITIQDITDRIERENELDQARNAAEQASVAKSSFLAMMSHEIRTPLNAVLGALGLLDEKALDPSGQKFLNVGRKGAESLLLIVNDILDFSKIEAGKLSLEPALFSVSKTVNDVLQVLEPRASEKKIWLTGDTDSDVPEFLIGDASRIRQVLLNLCSNAVRFTKRGGVHISLSQPSVEDGIARIRFQVEDTGCGVPLEDQAHLFDEFWGTSATASDKSGGTGLGLPISKRLVEIMGGAIGFESVPRCGSLFWFELPLDIPDEALVEAEKGKSKQFERIAPYEDLPALQGRVLLAEDNPANQLIAQAILERFGLQADVAANGHEAVAMVRSAPYDLVLMDINMPEMGGIEAMSIIRDLPGAVSRIPIIAMTALAMPGDREAFLSQGMDGYVGKPIFREELHTCIADLLEDRASAADTADVAGESAQAEVEAPIVDRATLQTLGREVGDEYLPEIVDNYLLEAPALVDEIMAGADRGDCEQVARSAHPLKSSSASLGAVRLADLAKKLELAGRARDLDAVRQAALRLTEVLKQTQAELLLA